MPWLGGRSASQVLDLTGGGHSNPRPPGVTGRVADPFLAFHELPAATARRGELHAAVVDQNDNAQILTMYL